MDWKSLFDLRRLNYWLLASGIGLNMIWTYMTLLITLPLLSGGESAAAGIQLGLMLSVFVGALLAGWLTGKLADDSRGPTYGLVGSLGSVGLIVFAILPAGILGLLAAIITVAGGINGGLLSLRRRK